MALAPSLLAGTQSQLLYHYQQTAPFCLFNGQIQGWVRLQATGSSRPGDPPSSLLPQKSGTAALRPAQVQQCHSTCVPCPCPYHIEGADMDVRSTEWPSSSHTNSGRATAFLSGLDAGEHVAYCGLTFTRYLLILLLISRGRYGGRHANGTVFVECSWTVLVEMLAFSFAPGLLHVSHWVWSGLCGAVASRDQPSQPRS